MAADLIRTQALISAHLMPLSTKGKNIVKETFDTYKAYSEILLPISKKQVNIKDMTKADLSVLSAQLKQAKKEIMKAAK